MNIAIDHITVPAWAERPFNKTADDRDLESIRKSGVQEPLVLVPDGKRMLLAKGVRRLRIAKSLGIAKVPYVVAKPPRGADADEYARELRLALNIHRQDLLASQKCSLIETLKERFSMNNAQVASYMGIDADSVTNWLAVKHYIQPVVAAMDAGKLTMQAARVFDGMTPEGQQFIWDKHGEELCAGSGTHKELRAKYPPDKYAKYYRNPELTQKRLARKSGPRNTKKRPTITRDEKRRLSSSLDMREIELREGAEEERRLKAEINASIPVVAAILRSESLWAMVPEEMRAEFERFGEVFV